MRLPFNAARRKFPRTSLYHTTTLSPTILQTDALKRGFGAVLLQNSTLVMFESRALTGSKKNYQNLERECLATIWRMEQVPLFSLWERIYSGNRPETACVNLQEAHGRNFSQNPEIGSKKFSIPAFQCKVQERSGNSTSRCSE